MTSTAAVLLVAAGVAAVADWAALAGDRRRSGLIAKPLVILLLVAAALAVAPADPPMRTFFVAALALSAAGDVALLAPARWFGAGLASFFLAHLAYLGGLLSLSGAGAWIAAGVALVAVGGLAVGAPVVRGAWRRSGAALGAAVALYLVAISAVVVAAARSELAPAVAGAVLLYASDGILGWHRFVRPIRRGRLLTRIPYHAGQGLMVLALVVPG